MSRDDINLIGYNETVKPDERLSANSVRLQEKSFKNTNKKWLAALSGRIDEMKQELSEIKYDQENIEHVENEVRNKSAAIARLEAVLKTEKGEEIPRGFVASRAIKLKKEWEKAAQKNCLGISVVKPGEKIVSPASVETSVEEVKPDRTEIEQFYDQAFGNIEEKEETVAPQPVVEEPIEINREEIEDEINKKIQELFNVTKEEEVKKEEPVEVKEEIPEFNFVAEERPGYTDEIYVPMTDDEITKARENIEYNQFQEIYANNAETKDENVREDIVIAPVREEEPVEVKEDIPEFALVEEDKVQEEVVEPKSVVVSTDVKEKLKDCSLADLQQLFNERKKAHEELEEAKSQALREKEQAEREYEEMKAAKEAREEEVRLALVSAINDLESSNGTLDSDIQNTKAEDADIKKNTESIKEELSKLDEISMMFSDNNKEEEEKQKTK